MILFNILCLIILWNLIASTFYLKNNKQSNKLYCGLIGYSGSKPFDKEKIKLLMIWNSFERGKDATGIYTPKNDLIKDNNIATKFLTDKSFKEDNLLIAHVRAKTVGSNTVKNAHPFKEGNTCLAHNGTLKNHYPLLRKYKLDFQYHDVDSHIITSIISQEKNFKVLNEIDGAAALLIHDIEDPTVLYVFRNKERPLFKGNYNGGMYISSIKESLEVIGCVNVKEFKEDYLYTIKDGLIKGVPSKIVNKPYSEPVTKNNSVVNTVNGVELYNTYVEYDGSVRNYYNVSNLTVGKEYLVIGYEKWRVLVKDDNGRDEWLSIYTINGTDAVIREKKYVKVRNNLIDNKDKKVFEKGDICVVTKDLENGKVDVLRLTDNSSWVISKASLKALTTEEEFNFLNPNANKQEILSFPEENFNFENINYEEVADDEEEESDEDAYYDLKVNETKLVNDLDNINVNTKQLIDFCKDLIPTEQMDEFNNKRSELELCISETTDYYNITNNTNATK